MPRTRSSIRCRVLRTFEKETYRDHRAQGVHLVKPPHGIDENIPGLEYRFYGAGLRKEWISFEVRRRRGYATRLMCIETLEWINELGLVWRIEEELLSTIQMAENACQAISMKRCDGLLSCCRSHPKLRRIKGLAVEERGNEVIPAFLRKGHSDRIVRGALAPNRFHIVQNGIELRR
jgi:hypothetical protein